MKSDVVNADVPVSFRVAPEVDDRITQLARYHGRSRSGELRMAVAMHDTRATLEYLRSTEGEADLGEAVAEAREQVAQDLRELEQMAYRPRPSLGTRSVMH